MTEDGKTIVHEREVSCGLEEDHPFVYYVIGESNEVICGYCNQTFRYVEKKSLEKSL